MHQKQLEASLPSKFWYDIIEEGISKMDCGAGTLLAALHALTTTAKSMITHIDTTNPSSAIAFLTTEVTAL